MASSPNDNPAATGAPPGRPSRLRRAVGVCGWLYLAAAGAAWVLLYAGDRWWPATLLLFGPRWLLAVPAVPLLPAALAWRRGRVPLLAGVGVVLGPVMGLHVPWGTLLPGPKERLRVMTCNLHYQEPDRAALERLLAEADPDVVVFQEPRDPATAAEAFAAGGWHLHAVPSLLLASRHPIDRAQRLAGNSMREHGLVGRYELRTPSGAVTLFSVHLASPRDGLYAVAHGKAGGVAMLQDNSALRRRQSEYLAALAAEEAGPVLLAGDFNMPSESAVFRHTWGGYQDAFAAAGWGWGYTFFGGRTAVRIDHILAGPGWRCRRCWVGPALGSPHRPVLADLWR